VFEVDYEKLYNSISWTFLLHKLTLKKKKIYSMGHFIEIKKTSTNKNHMG